MQDINQYRVLPVEKFPALILNTSPNWRESNRHEIGIILRGNVLEEELDAYGKPTKTEQGRYQSFARMLGRIVILLHPNNLRVAFTRHSNDPTMVLGSAVSRKLDAAGGDKVEAMTEKTNAPHWAEIFTFVEFKLLYSHSDSVLGPPVHQRLAG
ncbi:hypothetical protein BD779DRAFT_229020 [Infundibulicybe gibba]|nr:hypothetical protein BD779DRAFT_229020 [Infundibulicybe gibba]